jgi:hypothetical protein
MVAKIKRCVNGSIEEYRKRTLLLNCGFRSGLPIWKLIESDVVVIGCNWLVVWLAGSSVIEETQASCFGKIISEIRCWRKVHKITFNLYLLSCVIAFQVHEL